MTTNTTQKEKRNTQRFAKNNFFFLNRAFLNFVTFPKDISVWTVTSNESWRAPSGGFIYLFIYFEQIFKQITQVCRFDTKGACTTFWGGTMPGSAHWIAMKLMYMEVTNLFLIERWTKEMLVRLYSEYTIMLYVRPFALISLTSLLNTQFKSGFRLQPKLNTHDSFRSVCFLSKTLDDCSRFHFKHKTQRSHGD